MDCVLSIVNTIQCEWAEKIKAHREKRDPHGEEHWDQTHHKRYNKLNIECLVHRSQMFEQVGVWNKNYDEMGWVGSLDRGNGVENPIQRAYTISETCLRTESI